jgi:hypothetical protein
VFGCLLQQALFDGSVASCEFESFDDFIAICLNLAAAAAAEKS